MGRLFIISATPAGNLCVNLLFNDNTRQTINFGDFIRKHPHPQYNKYLDEKLFETFTLEDGNIVWGDDWDMIIPIEDLHAGIIA